MNFKHLLIAISLIMAYGARLFAADPALPFEGSGTAASPYLLKTAADIKTLADACAGESGATSGMNAGHYQGVHFAITADIDMSGIKDFYGIGSAPAGSASGISWYFAGIIDGRGHTVSNMHIDGLKTMKTARRSPPERPARVATWASSAHSRTAAECRTCISTPRVPSKATPSPAPWPDRPRPDA